MKKIILLLLVTVGISNTAYSQEISVSEKAILGKWEFANVISPEKSKEEIDEMKSMMESFFLEFRADKTCTLGIVMDLDGSWTIDAKKQIVTTTRRGETIWVIHLLKDREMTVSRNDARQKIVFRKL